MTEPGNASVITPAAVAKESLRLLVNKLQFARRMNRDYEKNFNNKEMKVGETITVKKPPRYIVRKGRTLAVQDHTQPSMQVAITDQAGVDLAFTSRDLALTLPEFSKKFLGPAIETLAQNVDYEAFQRCYQTVANAVGTPGTTPQTSRVFLQAGQKLSDEACPEGAENRTLLFNTDAQLETVEALKGLFNSSTAIGRQYMTGQMGEALGFVFGTSQNVPVHTIGQQGGTPVVNGASQVGYSLVTSGWTAAAANRLKKGDVFTIAGVYAVNMFTKQSTGKLRQFLVTADADSSGAGAATISIWPAIIPVGYTTATNMLAPSGTSISGTPGFGPQSTTNIAAHANVTASPANGAAITVLGAGGTLSPQNMAFHRDAFTMASVELPMPGGVDFAARASSSDVGLSVRIVRAYDINEDTFPCRLDIMYGFATPYPELACRVVG